ncbi:MAG: TonB-dependent receptor, partial [Desulfobacterales bacterium]|nr:TonB-dependent receptor [Desulfobacterales bacterium]
MSREKPWIEDKITCFLSKINLTTASIHLIAVMRLKIFVVFVTFHIFWAHEIHAQGVNEETGTDKPASYELEAVTVTSQKREEILQDVSGSITSFSQIELEDAGIDSILDLSRLVPGLEFDDFRHGAMFLRGIKSMPSSEPGTGFYVDGVNYSKSFMFGFPLFDVERVEVLKGPQGTLYGRNTIGGVINVHTVEPTNQAMCRLGGTLGDYGKKEFQGSVSFPLIQNRLFMRIAGAASEQDGYSENDVSPESHDNKDGHHLDGKAGRVKFRFLPTEKWDIALNIDGQWHDDGAFPTSRTERNPQVKTGLVPADAPYHYSNDYDGWQERTFWGAALNTKYDLKNVQLTSITSYRDYDRNEGIDTDFSALDLKRRKYRTREKDFSQEFRIVSDIDSALFKWQAGVNYFHLDTENTNANIFRPGMALSPSNPLNGTGTRAFFTDNVNAGGAVFGEVTYTLWHRLDLTGGLRYEYERAETDSAMRDMPDGAAAIERGRISSENSFSTLLPKVTAGWHFTDAHMAYTTFSEAHRSGGFNGFSAPQGD